MKRSKRTEEIVASQVKSMSHVPASICLFYSILLLINSPMKRSRSELLDKVEGDERFAKIKKDKRFRPISTAERKIKVDPRFAAMRDKKKFFAQRSYLCAALKSTRH